MPVLPEEVGLTPEVNREIVLEALRRGADLTTAARLVGVSRQALDTYRKRHPDFDALVFMARDVADEQVVSALFRKALSGDVTACIWWLKNRRPDEWRDRHEVGIGGGGDGPIDYVVTFAGATSRAA